MQKAMLHVLMQAYLDHAECNASCATAGTFVPPNLDVVIMQEHFLEFHVQHSFKKSCYRMNAICSSRHVILPLMRDVPVQ